MFAERPESGHFGSRLTSADVKARSLWAERGGGGREGRGSEGRVGCQCGTFWGWRVTGEEVKRWD